MLAAILICGASVFTSCTADNPDNPVKPIDNLSEKIIGKWMTADRNGIPLPTNMKTVIDFVSPTEAYCSASMSNFMNYSAIWKHHTSFNVAITGNVVTLTEKNTNEGVSVKDEFDITSVSDTELTAKRRTVLFENGVEGSGTNEFIRMVKVTADYSTDILGTWEGHVTSNQDEYGDGKEHRWEYKADGTYVYYVKDGDNWVASANTLNEFFIDGTLLCSRWIDNGTEFREWWDVEMDNNVMKWSALRRKADGTSYTASFEMKKVEASPLSKNY
jgi:hypothetical protein